MNVIVAALVRDEMSRYFESALAAWQDIADHIIILDDGSTDGTYEHAAAQKRVAVFSRFEDLPAWGREVSARKELWSLAYSCTSPGDVIFVLDADMVPLRNPREVFHATTAEAFAFNLYDLWGTDEFGRVVYRSDGLWQGHRHHRVWAVRRPDDGFEAKWHERGIHCGHFPINLPVERVCYVPEDFGLLHYAYYDGADRRKKIGDYLSVGLQLTNRENQHAASIGDIRPPVLPLLRIPEWPLVKPAGVSSEEIVWTSNASWNTSEH